MNADAPNTKAIRKTVVQSRGQTVMLGCVVKSNPESTLLWYKLSSFSSSSQNTKISNSNMSFLLQASANEFVRIDASDLKYHIHTFKQLNQTVSYLKIKVKSHDNHLHF